MVAPLPVHQAPATSKSPNPRRWRRRASTRSCAAKGDHYDRRSHGARRRLARARPGRVARPRPTVSCPRSATRPRAFAELELERLWPRVWQIACREEELAAPGDFVEYTIGDESIVDRARRATARSHAFHNACLHRGTAPRRRAAARSPTARSGARTTAGATRSTAALVDVPDRDEFAGLPDDLALRAGARRHAGAGSCSSTSTPTPSRCSTSSIRCPTLLAPYHLDEMRFRAVPHDDHRRELEGRRRRVQRGLPRAGSAPADPAVDRRRRASRTSSSTGTRTTAACPARAASCGRARASASRPTTTTRARSSPASSPGSAARSSARSAPRSRSCAPTGPPPGSTLLEAYQERRMELLEARGFDVSGLTPDLMTSADDVFWFPNVVGPIYPGSALLFRVRPYGRDPDRSIKDTWVLEWRAPGDEPTMPPSGGSSPTGATATGARSPSRTTRTSRTSSAECGRRAGRGLAESSPGGQHPAHASGHRPLSDLIAPAPADATEPRGIHGRR